jgi:hAT family C-terminal dimerisation region
MVNGFDERYKIPCTRTLKNRISKTYNTGKDSLKNQLTQAQYISLTLDAWSSPAHLPYLGVTAHWLTSNFEPCEILLSMEELPYPHGATEIQEHLLDLFYEWEIDTKISAIVTDNGSNVKKACNEIGIGERIPCAAHTLQLSIGKGLDKIKPLVDKCKHIITFLAGDKKKQQLKESQIYLYRQKLQETEELEKEVENLICLDVVKANNTRWNSTLYAFQRLVILKPAISMLKASLLNDTSSYIRKEGEKLEELYPTVHEWKVIKEMIELLNPFEIATRFLSGVKYPTIGFAYPSMCNLRERLESDFILLETSDVESCKNAILEDLISRWNFPQDLCLKGSFFDPRFKSLDFINSQEKHNSIVNELKEEFEIFKQNDISRISDKDIDNLTTAMGTFWQKKNSKIAAPIKDEFQHYFNVSELPALEEYDPYLWWSANKNQYPFLHKLAMKYISIPATSVPSERLFSDAKNLITPQRTRLDSYLINQLMFLKRNREYVDIYGVEAEVDI